jgi:nitrile hydratase
MPVLKAEDVAAALATGGPASVEADVPARFKPGERVRVRNINPLGHTRAPRYIRCKQGTIARDHGVFIFPDSHALGRGKSPQHLYSVRFTGPEVWGPEAPAQDVVHLDLWDSYLDPA